MSSNIQSISVEDATIKTATVEVKTLTLNGKQVTLAVFRQLKESPLLRVVDERSDECKFTGRHKIEFNGQPWGIVNYCPDKKCSRKYCHYDNEHLHIVWQAGNELRRTTVFRNAESMGWAGRFIYPQWHHVFDELRKLDQLFIAV